MSDEALLDDLHRMLFDAVIETASGYIGRYDTDKVPDSILVDGDIEFGEVAAMMVTALRNSGYEIVKLPKHVGVNGQDNVIWSRAPYIEQEFNGDVVIADRVGLDAGELLDVALALMGAAYATGPR